MRDSDIHLTPRGTLLDSARLTATCDCGTVISGLCPEVADIPRIRDRLMIGWATENGRLVCPACLADQAASKPEAT